jgi:VIT1/CCC1 family predicted Fe2+/Mn2+ transporter
MVLGLNDALVELTGTLAGLSFALQDNKLVALSGLITGISATFSMASSEYLSARSEDNSDAKKSALYTGIMYIFAVIVMVLPYLLFPSDKYVHALITMLILVVLIILIFTYYISVAKDLPFKKRFTEMATISLSVAGISFIVGILVKKFLGVDI